jgi:glycolate oxidase
MIDTARRRLVDLLGRAGCLWRPEDLMLYEYDAGVDKSRPDLVAFPRSTANVVGIVQIARECGLPVVARGAGSRIWDEDGNE